MHLLDLVDQVPLDRVAALDAEHLVGVLRALGEQVARLDRLTIFDLESRRGGHGVLALLTLFGRDGHFALRYIGRASQPRHDGRLAFSIRHGYGLVDLDPRAVLDHRSIPGRQVVLVAVGLPRDDLDEAAVFGALQLDHAVELGQDGLALRYPCFEQLLDPRQTRSDVDTSNTTRVERPHCELRTWLTDRLGRHDTHRVADLDHASRAHVPAVTVLADAVARLAGQRRAQVQLWHLARGGDLVANVLVDDRVVLGDHLTARLIDHVAGEHPAR